MYWYASDYCDVFYADRILEQMDPSADFAVQIIEKADLDEDDYLYEFGEYISKNELGTAHHLRNLPQETLQKMADVYDAYQELLGEDGRCIYGRISCWFY